MFSCMCLLLLLWVGGGTVDMHERCVLCVFICSGCSLASFKSLSQTKLPSFSYAGLTEEEDLAMSSDVNREAVFQATKVRTHLKKDGSWINRSQNVEDTQSDVKASSSVSSSIMPRAESTTPSSGLDSSTPPQSSNVMSALRKFDAHPVLEDSRRAHVGKAVETSIVKATEQPLKTPADASVKEIVKKPVTIPVEEPLKTHADTPKTDVVKKPVEEPLKTPTDVPVKNIVEKPTEKSLKTRTETVEGTRKTPVDGASTDQTQSSGVLQEKTAKTLHENPTKPSGTLTTKNKEDDTAEQVSIAHATVVEALLEPRPAENQPTSEKGELSLISALETPTKESSTRSTTEPTKEPRVTALEENHRLNSQAKLNKTMCSFCKLPIDGNVKISINIPAICCHPDCFKCNGCGHPLGDLSSYMYHYAGKILCEKCFDQIFQL
ncbi:zinc finger protein 185 isoform X2 [Carassius auratus]|uniref:Zinc finger protein 185 isoform X2 n=1 Tax=Carassius auratus TaxID=7957 RepID=A0A6P6K3Q3_CARAU|nr:zinc finger protein 185-like isoform X2 [Carassius auratus]